MHFILMATAFTLIMFFVGNTKNVKNVWIISIFLYLLTFFKMYAAALCKKYINKKHNTQYYKQSSFSEFFYDVVECQYHEMYECDYSRFFSFSYM